MFKNDEGLCYSASDLIRFAECRHHTVLDLQNLVTPLPPGADDPQADLLARKGEEHEQAFLARLRKEGRQVAEIDKGKTRASALRQTREAIASGAEIIFQAALEHGPFFGYADFLRRMPSGSYEVIDTKLARSAKGKFLVQLGLYSDMLAQAHRQDPQQMHLVLGDGSEASFRVADYRYYVRGLRDDFLAFAQKARNTYPVPCGYCGLCKWRDLCEEKRERDDHLSLVANMRGAQAEKLEAAGIRTVAALAVSADSLTVPKLAQETLAKLRLQARMQVRGRTENRHLHELLTGVPPERGFGRLPAPSDGDVYFDFEGDPLYEGGLEYLFGVGYFDKGKWAFMPIWAHSRDEERAAFETFMKWITARVKKHPGLHIYHYGHYETTALKRLMTLHGVQEAELDALLRAERFVDLFTVVRESLVISEPGYSLKNVEKFFMPAREGDVADAGASIVYYERWRESREQALLDTIESYNRFDVEATHKLVEWLRKLKPAGTRAMLHELEAMPVASSTKTHELEAALALLRRKLVEDLPAKAPSEQRAYRELVYSLMDFHRRAEKPAWWALFARCDASYEDLLDDMEAIAGCERVKGDGVVYRYPEQDFKLRVGSDVVNAENAQRVGAIASLDEEKRLVTLTTRAKGPPLPDRLSLGAAGPLNSGALRNAVMRFGHAVVGDDRHYPALHDLLSRHAPRIKGRKAGDPVLETGKDLLPAALEALLKLQDSTLFIQGPPGCGKTYSASWLIVELMRKGKRIGVSSNSHKAIHNLLEAIETRAEDIGFEFTGVKKSSADNEDSVFEGRCISSTTGKKFLEDDEVQLAAGTAWLFADEHAEQQFDYLFIDEAGQVSLANVVAMGMAARNIILVGDQMQLGQPVQGVHPGHSGESSLEYLLQNRATVPPDEGILLETTWRMHPDVCRFISDAVYDGRLKAHPRTSRQKLVLGKDADKRLKATGLVFVPLQHDNCRQRSEPEAQEVNTLYRNLLRQDFTDAEGKVRHMTPADILVVAPYNMQVERLKQVLPAGARVGTVDKFQGQEAEVVLVSMATSNGDCMPRTMDFLFSRNRLNVAISRARCLSILVACPDLLHISCSTPEQMALVNVLAWFAAEAKGK